MPGLIYNVSMGSVRHHPVTNDVCMLVSAITRKRIPFFRNATIAREAIETLYRVQSLHLFLLFAFVIMPDHCHLLVHVPAPNSIAIVMKQFKAGVSHNVGLGSLWQPRYHVRLPGNTEAARTYIHMNPVAAGLVEASSDYPWSSASGRWDVTDLTLL